MKRCKASKAVGAVVGILVALVFAGPMILGASGCGEMSDAGIIGKVLPNCKALCAATNEWVDSCEGAWAQPDDPHPRLDEVTCLQTAWDCGLTNQECLSGLESYREKLAQPPEQRCAFDGRPAPGVLPFADCTQ